MKPSEAVLIGSGIIGICILIGTGHGAALIKIAVVAICFFAWL